MNPQDPSTPPPQTPQPPHGGSLPPVDLSLYPQQPAASTQPPQAPPAYQAPTTPPSPVPEQPTPDSGIDYLNSIAPNQQKMASKFAIFGLIGGVLLAAIFAVLIIATPKGESSSKLIPPIAGRIATLETVTSNQQNHLNENQISETNASLNSALGSMDSDIQKIITSQKLSKSQTKAQVSAETAYANKLSKTFDDAYQRGTLDRTYTTQMIYELTILKNQITSLKKSTKNKDVQAFCESSITNIDTVLNSYDSFNASK